MQTSEQSLGVPTLESVRARIREVLSKDTFAHVQRTATLARELAEAHGEDPDRAELAALVHDVAHDLNEKALLHFAQQHQVPLTLTEARVPKLIHGAVGASILYREWGIRDEEILDAVRFHISGSATMGTLAKIIFVADKLEPERDHFYGGLGPLREMARVDLDQAILQLYGWRMNQLVTNAQPVHEDLSSARNALLERARERLGAHPVR